MASNSPHKTSDTTRVPSNVPNDYNHLGVPGSLDMPLAEKRRHPHARRRSRFPEWLKATLAVGGALFGFGLVLLVFAMILYPPYYRDLPPRKQAAWDHRFDRLGSVVGAGKLGSDTLRDALVTAVPTFNAQQELQGMTSPEQFATFQAHQAQTDVARTGAMQTADAAAQRTATVEAFRQLPPETQAAIIAASPDATNWMAAPDATSVPSPTAPGAQPTATPTPGGGLDVGMAPPEVTPLPSYPTTTPAPLQPTQAPLPPMIKLDNVRYEMQEWNNCGPTTMTMALSYYGWDRNQFTAAKWMKPHTEDKNVSPWQMVRFVNDQTPYRALYRMGGTTHLLKRLLAAGFPVVVEEGFQPAGEEWMGHYLLLIGYDDYQQHFLAYDSYLGSNSGQGYPHPYSVLDENWRHFNRVFMVVYDESSEMALRKALGDYVDLQYTYQAALDQARDEVDLDNQDKWAWFNMGSAYVALGDYESAAIAYDRAYQLDLPWRMMWYQFGPYEAYFHTGRYEDVMVLADTNKNITPYVEETYYWQAMVYAARGDIDTALRRFNDALRYNGNYFPAQKAKAEIEAGTFQVANAGS